MKYYVIVFDKNGKVIGIDCHEEESQAIAMKDKFDSGQSMRRSVGMDWIEIGDIQLFNDIN